MEIYCTRPTCPQPHNSFPELDAGGTLKTAVQKFCLSCGMPLLLAGRYIPEKPLARGGFGATFLARDRYTPALRQCVVKQLQPIGFNPQQMELAKQMFEREGAVLDQLGRHPQIPDLLAFFEMPAGKDDFFYLVQEFIDGFTLEQLVELHGAIAEADVLEIMHSLLPVLQFVHENGSIHRDIKPSNIMIRKSDQVYFLLDFGAVKQLASMAPGQKSTGIFTPGYGAPEQMRGDTVFAATDLYAFAVTCLHLLTGKPPEELFDVQSNEWHWQPFVTLHPRLEAILRQMLEPTPSRRFASATDVLVALRQMHTSMQTSQAPTALPPSPQPAVAAAAAQPPVPSPSSPPAPAALRGTPWLLQVPMGVQLTAAFLLGLHYGLWGQILLMGVAERLGMVSAAIILLLVVAALSWLRVGRVLDNKDLAFFSVLGGLVAWGAIAFGGLAPFLFPPPQMAAVTVLAGLTTVIVMILFRLLFVMLYSVL
ncbi:MAG: serine/threonine protein kinase [Oscillatoriales cyanobacterium SM2_2_1]|nr:serine/threonine protein kinase [Oscillatoriales cyanobacterium SM2_2_1]